MEDGRRGIREWVGDEERGVDGLFDFWTDGVGAGGEKGVWDG